MENDFSNARPLVLVGCGHMGQALAEGWLKAGLVPDSLIVVDPAAKPGLLAGVPDENILASAAMLKGKPQAHALVLAVKPQMADSVLAALKPSVGADTLVISIAAGVTLDQIKRGLDGAGTAVRAMPNTPAAVGAGISALAAEMGTTAGQKALASTLLGAVGSTVWLEDENQMNAVTAVSGSGPAYVFHLVECMAAAGAKQGLPSDVAEVLSRQTLIGAARLLEAKTSDSALDLRRQVASPGGTTAAALEVLMAEGGLSDLMAKAIRAARKRGDDLAG